MLPPNISRCICPELSVILPIILCPKGHLSKQTTWQGAKYHTKADIWSSLVCVGTRVLHVGCYSSSLVFVFFTVSPRKAAHCYKASLESAWRGDGERLNRTSRPIHPRGRISSRRLSFRSSSIPT